MRSDKLQDLIFAAVLLGTLATSVLLARQANKLDTLAATIQTEVRALHGELHNARQKDQAEIDRHIDGHARVGMAVARSMRKDLDTLKRQVESMPGGASSKVPPWVPQLTPLEAVDPAVVRRDSMDRRPSEGGVR